MNYFITRNPSMGLCALIVDLLQLQGEHFGYNFAAYDIISIIIYCTYIQSNPSRKFLKECKVCSPQKNIHF